MKKYLLIVLILFASFLYTISYASDDTNSDEKVFKLKDVDTPPRVIKGAPLIYPKKVTIEGLILSQGLVKLRFIVTKDGGVRNPEVIEAVPEGIFEASAIESIKRFKFSPATKNGEPVDCTVIQPITFVSPDNQSLAGDYKNFFPVPNSTEQTALHEQGH
jgi:TonB family protein